MTRNLMLVILLVASVGVPYLMYSDNVKGLLSSISIPLPSSKSRGRDTDREIAALLSAPESDSASGAPTDRGAQATGPEVEDMQIAFRFNATPEWVTQNWSRISVLEIDGMKGMRVPYVSGLRLHDVAGSLTYCFDDSNQLQRIMFRGVTGDPQQMQQIAETGFGLRSEGGRGGLFVARWNGEPTSYMMVDSAPVMHADSPHTRFQIRMELNRPRSYLKVSDELTQTIAAHQTNDKSWRW